MDESKGNSAVTVVAVLITVVVGMVVLAVVGQAVSAGVTTVVEGVPLAVGEAGHGKARASAHSVTDIARNPLLTSSAKASPVDCALPALGNQPTELEAYYRAGIVCLNDTWRPLLTAADLPFVAPDLDIADRPRTRCGFAPSEDEATAFYCARDRVIYMPRSRLMRDAGEESAYHLAVLAHEYGHHVQAMAGILGSADDLESTAPRDAYLELSRRAELQANCFAGVFLAAASGRASVSTDLATASARSFEDTLGADTHGNRENQASWAMAGFRGATPHACDTWSATPAEVD